MKVQQMDGYEPARNEAVNQYMQVDFNRTEFQDVVDLAAKLCEKPVALITLIDGESNWLKVRFGTNIEKMPGQTSFCQYSIMQDELLIIPDATKDARFQHNPLVQSEPRVRFYAGAPLTLENGLKIGTLCLFDYKPSTLNDTQKKTLSILARQATFIMQMQLNRIKLEEQMRETDAKNAALSKIAQLQSHQIRQPLTTIMGLVNLVRNGHQNVDAEWLSMLAAATDDFDKIIIDIVSQTIGNRDLSAIRYNKMVEEIDEYAILLMDKEGNVENWNRGAEKIKGYRASEIIGKNFSTFYTEDERKANKPAAMIAEAAKAGVAREEGWRIRKDGSKFFALVVITAIHDDKGSVIGFTKVTKDLTKLREAEDGLRVSAEMYELLSEQAGEQLGIGGWQLDLEKQILTWTAKTRQIHGVDEAYVPRLSTAINFYKEGPSRTKIENAIESAIAYGLPWDLKLQIVNARGDEMWVRAIGRSNYDGAVCTKVYGTIQRLP